MRIADWFGIRQIICSHDTVDVFNPKVVQATMGAISRVKVVYEDLPEFLKSNPDVPCYGTFLDGENLYGTELSAHGFIVMVGVATSESLNVGMATAIVVGEFRRRMM